MRKAVFEIGNYTVREGQTGGWRVYVTGAAQPTSVHDDRAEAVAAAKRYQQADDRRAA